MKKIKILIIGGDDAYVLLVRGELEGMGYQVDLEQYAKDALAKLHLAESLQDGYSLIIVHSTRLPDMNTEELIRQVATSPASSCSTHIILCSGAPNLLDDSRKYMDAGAERIFPEPYDLEQLVEAISDLVAVH